MPLDDLLRSRRQLAAGVGQTTRKNRVLPFSPLTVQIPARIGIYDPGAPEAPVVEPPPCLQGEIRSTNVTSPWLIAWHADEPILLSSDAVWRLDPTPWKRWSGYTNNGSATIGTLVHFNFSSPTTPAALASGAGPTHVQMVEGSWATRTWYAKQLATVPHAGLLACVQRLKSTQFTQNGVTPPYSYTWTYSDDGEAATDATTPACINRTGHETGLTTRVYNFDNTLPNLSGFRHIQRLFLILAGFKTAVETKRGHGFLPSIKDNDIALYVGDTTGNADNLVCTDLAKILSVGQPWHGLCTATGIERPGFAVTTPSGYVKPVTTNTRYFKAIDPPGAPDSALLPPGFAAAGYEYLDDVVLLSGTDYSPKKVFNTSARPNGCTNDQWYHCDDAGVVRRMAIIPGTRTANSTFFSIYDLGPVGGIVQPSASGTFLGSFEVVSTDPIAATVYSLSSGMRRFESTTGDYQISVATTGGIISPNLRLATIHPIAASPDGRQIAVLTGAILTGSYTYPNGIYTVATFDIASDRTITGPNYVYQFVEEKPTDAVTNHFWDTWYADDSASYPWKTTWWVYGYKYTQTFSTQKIQTTCHGVCYDKAGNLHLFLRHKQVFGNGEWAVGPWPNTMNYDSGIPLTSPMPDPSTTTPPDMAIVQVDVYPDLTYAYFPHGNCWMSELGTTELDPVWDIYGVYRIANNVIVANVTRFTPGGASVTAPEIAAPTVHDTLANVFPTTTANEKWASWNPRTNTLAGRNDGSGAISWL